MRRRTPVTVSLAGLGLAGISLAAAVPAVASPVVTKAKAGSVTLLVSKKAGAKEKGGTFVIDKTVGKELVKVGSGHFTFGKKAIVKVPAGTYTVIIKTTKSTTTDKKEVVKAGKTTLIKNKVA